MLFAAGRFDRPVRVRRKVTRSQRRYNDLIVRSEQSRLVLLRNLRWAVLRFSGPHAKGDVTIENRREFWKRLDGYAVLLSTVKYLNGRKQNWGVVGKYQRPKTKTLRLVIGVHMPARVEGALRRDERTVETRAWMESLYRLGAEVEFLKAKHPGVRIDVVGDWNVHVADAYFRTLISTGLGLRPAKPVDERGNELRWKDVPGTHHHRVIDWGWSTDPDATCRVRAATPASDHHPVRIN